MIKVTCFGASGSVTGSNFLVEGSDGKKVIIDCGLFQGGKQMELRNSDEWGYDPKEVKYLILTHAHIDHSGRIPKIVKDGFAGKIITSPPTADLCEVMLLDSAHVQEMDAEWQSRKRKRRAKRRIEPLYTTEDAEKSLSYFVPMERDTVIDLEPGMRARLRNAGHILGSAMVELWIEDEGKETKIVFSGDLGRQDQPIVKDPFNIAEADYLFIESTYGNRFHRDFDESKAELLEAILHAYSNNEKAIIPAFAVERTQEVLYVLGEFARAGKLPDIPVYLDSPLAIRATEIFRKNKRYFDEEARAIIDQGFDPFDMPNLKFTMSTRESIEINERQGPAIVISANGMCTAGRIKHHLKHNLWRSGASLIIMGFQAQGTTGRRIVEGAEMVTIFGEKVAVKAKVFTIGGVSAHADQGDLLRWLGHSANESKPKVFAIHGEQSSCQALADAARERLGLEVYVPQWREVLELDPRSAGHQVMPPTVSVDLQEDAAALTTELVMEIDRLKERLSAGGKAISETDLERLRDMRDELRDVGSE